MNLYLLFHLDFCTSVSNCSSMLPSKHSLVQRQQQDTRKWNESAPKLTIKREESRYGVFIVNFE